MMSPRNVAKIALFVGSLVFLAGCSSPPLGSTWYLDADGDGWGLATTSVQEEDAPVGYVARAGDCDDASPGVNPDAPEVPDGLVTDENCDGQFDESVFYVDDDGDDWGAGMPIAAAESEPFGATDKAGDCDDRNEFVNPERAEDPLNFADDNCDGQVDEFLQYADSDGDGFGSDTSAARLPESTAGYVRIAGDCDDGDENVNPFARDVDSNGIDDDCDGTVDDGPADAWFRDLDGDGYGDPVTFVTGATNPDPGEYVGNDGDCDDQNAASNPSTAEVIGDFIDNDCDFLLDESVWFEDQDGDFFGDASSWIEIEASTSPSAYTHVIGDCSDVNFDRFPGRTEIIDNFVDDDCDGDVDETTWFEDADGDGWGSIESTLAVADRPEGYRGRAGDCDDADAAIHPGSGASCFGGP